MDPRVCMCVCVVQCKGAISNSEEGGGGTPIRSSLIKRDTAKTFGRNRELIE